MYGTKETNMKGLSPKVLEEIAENDHQVDMKYIEQPYQRKANIQAFSCFAETREVDFDKSQTRDEVSFYKGLAKITAAKELGIDIKEYERRMRLHKSGKY